MYSKSRKNINTKLQIKLLKKKIVEIFHWKIIKIEGF